MSYRNHWTQVQNLSIETMRADEVPSAVEDDDEDVLVIFDHGNQESLVIAGDPDDWRQLAELIRIQALAYEEGVR